MSALEFFIIPGATISMGIDFFFMLFVSGEKLKNMSGEMQIGKYDKNYFAKLSPRGRKRVRYIVLYATIAITTVTSLIALVFVILSSYTLVSFFLCLALQVAMLFLIGAPFYRKIQSAESDCDKNE